MFSIFKEKAKNLTGSASQKTGEVFESGTKKGQDLFNEYYPKIEHVIVNGMLGIAEDKLKDEEFIENCFEKAYEVLPIPVRLLISRKYFINLALKHKEPLLLKVITIREQRGEQINSRASELPVSDEKDRSAVDQRNT